MHVHILTKKHTCTWLKMKQIFKKKIAWRKLASTYESETKSTNRFLFHFIAPKSKETLNLEEVFILLCKHRWSSTGTSSKLLLKCSRCALDYKENITPRWYLLGPSFLLHLWFGALSLISHPSSLQLPNQGQNLSCRFIPAGPVNKWAVSLEHKIWVLKRSYLIKTLIYK